MLYEFQGLFTVEGYKVKLALVLTYAQRYADVWESGGIGSRILVNDISGRAETNVEDY
jgi:hypothetical protein